MTPLSREARGKLLGIARQAIDARLRGERFAPVAGDPRLLEARGAFVTLSRRGTGELRGCVGYVEPLFPLAETVARAAVAAALEDDRFARVTGAELPSLSIDLSLLEPPRPIRAEEVEVGRHGLIVSCGGRRGLLLPQVPVEQGWDRERFLEQTCLKAGLPKAAWRRADTELLGFAAELFGDDEY
jgi:AmmeMemoRadiSam system protein A